MMRKCLIVAILLFENCGFYLAKEFVVENKKPFYDDYGWEIIPSIEGQREYGLKNRYSVDVCVSRFIDVGKNLYRESEFDAKVIEIQVALPDTCYTYTQNTWDHDSDEIDKKFYYYHPKIRNVEEAKGLPYINKDVKEISLSCIVEYTHKNNGSVFKKTYLFKMEKDRFLEVEYLLGV